MDDLITRIITAYGFTADQIHPAEKGYRNHSYPVTLTDGRVVNIIIYKAEDTILEKITAAHTVSNLLIREGFPVRHPLDPRIMKLMGTTTIRYAALYPYLPGNTIPWEGHTKKHIKLLGETLSNMHAALRKAHSSTRTLLPQVTNEYTAIVHRIRTYMAYPTVVHAIQQKLEWKVAPDTFHRLSLALMAGTRSSLKHPLHMDFVRSNVLFDNQDNTLVISGILDLEKAAYGHPLFDIARTLSFLLVDCAYTPEASIRKYFLYSGYQKRGRSSLPHGIVTHQNRQFELLELLIDLFLMHDLYKFLRHNPYESLCANEHYVRTRDMLMRRGRILRI